MSYLLKDELETVSLDDNDAKHLTKRLGSC